MSNYSEYDTLDQALIAIRDNKFIQRLISGDITAITEIESDNLLKRAINLVDGGSKTLSDAKSRLVSAKRPSRDRRSTGRFNPVYDDSGKEWVKGSGCAGKWSDRQDPTDRHDLDIYTDGSQDHGSHYDHGSHRDYEFVFHLEV
jgi:hypothetical protein